MSVVPRPLIYRSKGKSEPAEGRGNVMAFCLMKKIRSMVKRWKSECPVLQMSGEKRKTQG